MVTDEERDYMYRAYADDPQARVNLGIRRRLAPLLRNNRRKIELMNALLLSLPGTPIIYYGDELGMGDNIYLGDRDGVRTPMQWNADRNAGFSRANPQQLFLPPVIDSEYHYATVNVEVEQNSPHSLLWWMRRIVNLRKQHAAFGRGSMEFLTPDNAKVLAYLREYDGETLLIVANLSRFAQFAELDLSRFRGQTPVELFGQAKFPTIGELPYMLTLGPYAFYWFHLAWQADELGSVGVELPTCEISGAWDDLFEGRARTRLEKVLPSYLQRQRWFGGKARTIQNVQLLDVIAVPGSPLVGAMRLLLVQVKFTEGEPDIYSLPVVFAVGGQAANITGDHPRGGILRVERADGHEPAILCEAMWEDEFWQPLYNAVANRRVLKGRAGEVVAEQSKRFRRLTDALRTRGGSNIDARSVESPAENNAPTVAVHGGEQSNTSVVLGECLVLKVFRRLTAGENPDLELSRFLTDRTKLTCVPEFAGALTYQTPASGGEEAGSGNGKQMTLGVMHELVENEGDAWVYTLDELGRYAERVEPLIRTETQAAPHHLESLPDLATQAVPNTASEMIGSYLQSAELLGVRTGELHLALASGSGESFAPEPFTRLYQRSLYQSMRSQSKRALQLLRKRTADLPEDARAAGEQLCGLEEALLQRFHDLVDHPITAVRTRCHGDFHLGQVLFTGKDFVIIDFEGEPGRPTSERRIKTSPLRDVAGMIRSFHYASHAALRGQAPGALVPDNLTDELADWMQVWYTWSAAAFLRGYAATISGAGLVPEDPTEFRILLDAYLLEKAVYELTYELNNRPAWVKIPLEGILKLVADGPVAAGGA